MAEFQSSSPISLSEGEAVVVEGVSQSPSPDFNVCVGTFARVDESTGLCIIDTPTQGQISVERTCVKTLRSAMRDIQQSDLSDKEKAQRMHTLMNPPKPSSTSTPTGVEPHLSASMAPPCEHYQCRCVIIPKCCPSRPFKCRLCHDEHVTDHRIDRFATDTIICEECDTIQPVSNQCTNCGIQFGEYFCPVCKLWKKNDAVGTFHCEDCGICRVGMRSDYTHCHTCCMCIPGEHTCLADKYKAPCSVCQEDLFSSREPTASLPCGHPIHSRCLMVLRETSPYCPLCKKSTMNLSAQWRQIQALINAQPMPEEFNRTVTILCNDCQKYSSDRPFHFLGVRCIGCGSFNTTEVDDALPPNATRAAASEQTEDGDDAMFHDLPNPWDIMMGFEDAGSADGDSDDEESDGDDNDDDEGSE